MKNYFAYPPISAGMISALTGMTPYQMRSLGLDSTHSDPGKPNRLSQKGRRKRARWVRNK